jgi:hypothetical protein
MDYSFQPVRGVSGSGLETFYFVHTILYLSNYA